VTADLSPYAAFINSPIWLSDPSGDTVINGQKYEPKDAAHGTYLPTVVVVARKNAQPQGQSIAQRINVYLKRGEAFVAGVANAWSADQIGGAGRQDPSTMGEYEDYARYGQTTGDVGATITGLLEIGVGGAGEGLGGALDATGVGAVAGVPLNIVSGAVVAHGTVVIGVSGANIIKDFVYYSSDHAHDDKSSNGSSDNGSQDNEGVNSNSQSNSSPNDNQLKALAKKLNLNINSPTTKQLLENIKLSCSDFISRFRSPKIRGEFPGEFLNKTVEEALKSANTTVRKLLTDSRFVK
jgi:hypothetical protein